jgi:tetratricopeptide (TPR) repeat protein
VTTWRIEELDARIAAKTSLPRRLPVPEDVASGEEFEITRARAAAWASEYLADHADDDPALGRLVAKEEHWIAAEGPLLAEDWEAAVPHLQRIVAIDPEDAAARFNLASAERGSGRPERALAMLADLDEVFGDEGAFHANVGRTHEALGDRDAAVAAYHRALEILPGDGFVLDRLAALGDLVSAFGPDGEPIYVDATEFANSVREDLAAHAEDVDYLTGAAQALLAQGQPDLARNAAELALAARPGSPDALLLAGAAHADLGHLDRALALLDDHLAAEPRSAAGHSHRGRVLHALGRIDEARAAARTAFELDPNDLVAVQTCVAGDDGAEAVIGRLSPLMELRPEAWGPWRLAGDVLLTTGDHDAAMAHWRRAVDLGADDLTIGLYLGELGRAGQVDELVEIADGLTRLAEREPGLRWNAASGYAEAGREAEARIVFASIAHDERVAPDMRAAAAARARGEA